MADGVKQLAMYLSCWFLQDVVMCALAITLIVGQFWKNRQTLYVLVYFTAYAMVFRVFITWHIGTMHLVEGWSPSLQLKLFWAVYYTGYLAFLGYFFVTVKRHWKENGWFNHILGIFVLTFMLLYGYALVWKPYRVLYNTTREQGIPAEMRQT
ncbi:hypothetical protein BVY04_05460 [bacterium M21]|nr:hypothetical protein BVY04_05460 [bacterium M21]